MSLRTLVALACFPAALAAQYPALGTYKGSATQVGGDAEVALTLVIEQAPDSTVVKLFQDPKQPPIPLTSQRLISNGFEVVFANLTCPFVATPEHWEAICVDPLDAPLFTVRFARKAEPPAPTG